MDDKKRKFIVSVDDGSRFDLKLGDLLLKYKIPSIFYIAPNTCDLDASTIRKIARGDWCPHKNCPHIFEIGGHTMNHPQDLKKLDDERLKYEIFECKKELEKITGLPVDKFCYTRGRFDERVKQVVKDAGFKEARTTRIMSTEFPKDPFETDVSIHIYPDRKEYGDKTWVEVGRELMYKVVEEGGRFEVFCHSWEIDKFNFWEFVEDFFFEMDEVMKKLNYKREI